MPELKDYKVNLDNYYGPLDLLLHLVKETEIDVTRVSLAQVASQYIAFLEELKKLDLELGGEFIAMASQLLLIKSRTLVPPGTAEEEEEEEQDPSMELIRKLLEYKIYKDRGREMGRLEADRSLRFGRPAMRFENGPAEEPLKEMQVWDLVVSFARIAKSVRLDSSIDILYRSVPIEVFIEKILAALRGRDAVAFRELLEDPHDRGKTIGTFLAILELMKEQRVRAEQPDGGEIRLRLN